MFVTANNGFAHYSFLKLQDSIFLRGVIKQQIAIAEAKVNGKNISRKIVKQEGLKYASMV
jgi:ribosome-associated protein YbcJ (S4-like RNA binding protein)